MSTLIPPAALAGTAAVAAATALLSACGGGGSAASTPSSNASGGSTSGSGTAGSGTAGAGGTPPISPSAITPEQAARFLHQAAFAATDAHIARVQTLGYAGWIDEQFAAPRTQSHWDWMVARGYNTTANVDNFNGTDNTLWRKFIGSPDVLRQRMTLALSEILVISMAGLPVSWRGFLVAAYVDILEANAFGNYRQLLQEVTLSPAMGV